MRKATLVDHAPLDQVIHVEHVAFVVFGAEGHQAVGMGVEKNVSWGRRMSAPVGILLIAWGLILFALA